MLPIITDGIAKMIMKDVTTYAQTNTGTRLRVMPGARIFIAVTMISIAPTSAAISVNVIICAQMSTRFPGEMPAPTRAHS